MLIFIRPGVQVNAIECDALSADGYHHDVRTHVAIEPIFVHTQVARRVAQTNEARGYSFARILELH